jgi:glutamate carboxypeptidase
MQGLSSIERDAVERAMAVDMLRQVEGWSAINSGSRNLGGLAAMAGQLAEALSILPGDVRLVEPEPVEALDESGNA